MKTALRRILPFAVSAAALVWLARGMDYGQMRVALNWQMALVIVPALLAYGAVTLLLEAASLVRLVGAADGRFGSWTAARIKSASYLLGILHYALGAAALTLLLRRRAGLKLTRAASLVLMIAAVDVVIVLVAAATAASLAELDTPGVRGGVLALALAVVFGGFALLRAPGSLGPLERIRSLAVFESVRTLPARLLGELVLLRTMFVAAFLGICAAAFYAFGLAPPPAQLIVGSLIVAVVAVLPIAVAGIGTTQMAFVYLFAGVAPQETLFALSLVFSAGMLSLRALIGVAFAREYTREALEATRAPDP